MSINKHLEALDAAFEKHWEELEPETRARLTPLAKAVAKRLYFDGRIDVRIEFVNNAGSRSSSLAPFI